MDQKLENLEKVGKERKLKSIAMNGVKSGKKDKVENIMMDGGKTGKVGRLENANLTRTCGVKVWRDCASQS